MTDLHIPHRVQSIKHRRTKPTLANLGGEVSRVNLEGVELMEYADAKAKKESYLAHLAEIEYSIKQDLLIDRETVFRALRDAATACREGLLSIPGRYAALFAVETDAKVIEQTLEQELRAALDRLTDADLSRPTLPDDA